jgi:very-short-patch-repair endonuclease
MRCFVIERAKIFRKTPTHAELLLWNGLKNRQLSGYKFRRQHPINRFIADFFCYEVKLIVEIDGKIHQLPLNYEHDIGRTKELERFGMHIIRFTNDQVENDLDFVL